VRKLPARYAAYVTPFVLSIFMSAIVSFIATLRAVGFSDSLFMQWLGAWGLSWLIAFPTLLVVMPVVRKIVGAVVESK
jgi:hypothetical protein